ncbi:1-phosphofructokinase [Fundicoccus culcitae]|uniref:Tagatose-6-phosphate kinase n=1 Tax=Fundicoccus culcitae TaxID=2969821 RepID=A0ABY5P3H8_9LACT|nr:1-phosphofructokinase [Fundicoccus culcitae]UUX32998.1 1-phosphofructokinase [Fundicoccus culcitae]
MIYTITLNPAIDLVLESSSIQLGQLNRIDQEEYLTGGKGINISRILNRMGQRNIATGFLGGFTGDYIIETLNKEGIETLFISIDDLTRVNVTIQAEEITDLNTKGPEIPPEAVQELIEYLSGHVTRDDTVFIAGDVAPGIDSEFFHKLATLCLHNETHLVLDINKPYLIECLAYHPFLIKPNLKELSDIFEIDIKTVEEIIQYAKKLQERGARNVLVSRGADGAILVTEEGQILMSKVPKGEVINAVGAGDAMIAGFIKAYVDTQDYSSSLGYATAAGSATAFSTGLADIDEINTLVSHVTVDTYNG